MSSTPAERLICLRCRTLFETPARFCRECGTELTRSGPLEVGAQRRALDDTAATTALDAAVTDRRLSDSNQTWMGKLVDGRYRVLEVIGRGGMGVVYRVEHLRMGKIAAMKVLHHDLANQADVVQRFELEAAAVSKLHHPHTVQVFDFGNAQGALYLIMELVRGLDLSRLIARDGPMPWARAAPVFAQICGALQEAHDLRIVHRDLKPENVLLTRTTGGRDYAKVLDFGLAKLDRRGAPMEKTDRNAIVGTPFFMAPEQIRGDDVDARTDIYSLGALMFEVLTGEHLYSSSTAVGVLTKHLTADPDAPSARAPSLGIPPAVDRLCLKALARDPSGRWQSATELGAAIEAVFAQTSEDTGADSRSRAASLPLAGGRLVADPDEDSSDLRLRRSDIDSYERGLRRRRGIVLAGMIVFALGVAGAAAWFVMRKPAPLRHEREPNDDRAHATHVVANAPITGYLGKRNGPGEGDRDTFLVKWPAGSRRVITVTVAAPPNIDISLTINHGADLHEVTMDEAGIGEAESLHRRSVDGPVSVTIAQTIAKDQRFPVENVSDPYTLTVQEDNPSGEFEPNNIDADATPLVVTEELRGYLDTRQDLDVLRWTGEPGTYNVVVRADGIPLAWRLGDGKLRTPGAASVVLRKAELIKLERTDRSGKGTLKGRDVMWSITVTK